MTIWSLDTESYYDKEMSITTMGAWGYVFHPEADHYLVSVAGSDGTRYVGPPEGAPWGRMGGGVWLSWNAAYDGLVWQRLVRDGRVPKDMPIEWHDPADMVAYMGYPRSLKMAIKALYKEDVSKGTRDKMKGKRWRDMSADFRAEVEAYAKTDAELPLRVWDDYSGLWPEKERRLSRLTREMGWRGVRIDVPRVERGIELMQKLCWAAEQKIPWSGAKLSYPKLCEACQAAGIEAPFSLAEGSTDDDKKSDDVIALDKWLDKHSSQFPWVGAMRIKRRCNAVLKKLKTIHSRVREDGTVPTELKYFGAGITGRWSGSGGVNWQNLPREEQFGKEWWEEEGKAIVGDIAEPVTEGVYLRSCIIPREGNHLLVSDLEQIEPRCSAVLTEDVASVNLMHAGYSPYDAHAVATGMSEPNPVSLKKRNPSLYSLAKARELALGYGAGHEKFLMMAPIYVSQAECDRIFSMPVNRLQEESFLDFKRWMFERGYIKEQWGNKSKADRTKLVISRHQEALSRLGESEKNGWDNLDDATKEVWTENDLKEEAKLKWEKSELREWSLKSPDDRRKTINSWLIVKDYRRNKPRVTAMWERLDNKLRDALTDGTHELEVTLPSHRKMIYRHVDIEHGSVVAVTPHFGKMMPQKFYGGALFNNLVQGTARDVFAECWLRLDKAGYEAVLSVHDELVIDAPVSVTPESIRHIMSAAPEWMPSLPVAAECSAQMRYTK